MAERQIGYLCILLRLMEAKSLFGSYFPAADGEAPKRKAAPKRKKVASAFGDSDEDQPKKSRKPAAGRKKKPAFVDSEEDSDEDFSVAPKKTAGRVSSLNSSFSHVPTNNQLFAWPLKTTGKLSSRSTATV